MNTKTIGQGRWVALHEITYHDGQGAERKWECVRRVGTHGAACMVASVARGGETCLVVVKQFRPPANAPVLELPAGLIDANEEAAATALRELAEETGFRGQIVEIGPFVYNSPGMSDERTSLVRISISGEGARNPDAGEEIEVLLMPLRGLKGRLLQEEAKGAQLDAKLWSFAVGLEVGQTLHLPA